MVNTRLRALFGMSMLILGGVFYVGGHPHKIAQKLNRTRPLADWTIATYIQADNNLAPFATYNINNMQQANLVSGVNMLVQWDQPNNNKTWRYRIVRGGRIEDVSLSTEMGINPGQELVSMMRWAKTKYEARRYAAILWNHGNGVVDPRSLRIHPIRGILFDDSQNTYLNNQGLATACAAIKSEVLGKNIDLVGMDACLMAMLEVGYQIRDSVDVLVGSQNTEPGEGWSYVGFLQPLCLNPSGYDAKALASAIVAAYGKFYKRTGVNDYTQSAFDLSKIGAVAQSIDQFVAGVDACAAQDSSTTKSMIRAAHSASINFNQQGYIDLGMFYKALLNSIKNKKHGKGLGAKALTPSFKNTLSSLELIIAHALLKMQAAVCANAVGSRVVNACGMSIYFPGGSVDASYPKTLFAQATQWLRFIRTYR